MSNDRYELLQELAEEINLDDLVQEVEETFEKSSVTWLSSYKADPNYLPAFYADESIERVINKYRENYSLTAGETDVLTEYATLHFNWEDIFNEIIEERG